MPSPPVRGPRESFFDPELAAKAIDTVKAAMPLFVIGVPITRGGPAGDVHVDVPVMYMNFAIDRVHYDPNLKLPSPKGRPVRAWNVEIDAQEIKLLMERILKEARVVEAAEYRDPEDAWVIPIAWRTFIIMHVKVSCEGSEIIPDYGLTEEIRRHVT